MTETPKSTSPCFFYFSFYPFSSHKNHRAHNACKFTFFSLLQQLKNQLNPSTMTTIDLVIKALLALKPRTGASSIAIGKWIEANEGVSLLNLFEIVLFDVSHPSKNRTKICTKSTMPPKL
jgi:hypothetical protein